MAVLQKPVINWQPRIKSEVFCKKSAFSGNVVQQIPDSNIRMEKVGNQCKNIPTKTRDALKESSRIPIERDNTMSGINCTARCKKEHWNGILAVYILKIACL